MNELELDLIIKQNKQIERHFEKLKTENEDINLNCVDIIGKLRTLIEHIVTYHYGVTNNIEYILTKDNIRQTIAYMKNQGESLRFLTDLHLYLQACSSHYVIDEISSPRLLWKYIPYLFKIREWFRKVYCIDILCNIENANHLQQDYLTSYYKKIYDEISSINDCTNKKGDRYYVYKSVPIIVNNDLIYETTISIASDYTSKFNRFIVFSNFEIDQRYAARLDFIERIISVNNISIPIKIVTDYSVSIRPCEFNNLGRLVDIHVDIKSSLNEYKHLMEYMTRYKRGLHEIVLADDKTFTQIKSFVLKSTTSPTIFKVLEKCRSVINKGYHGKNVLRYLLVTMNNKVIKDQLSIEPNHYNLYIANQPFDSLPIAMSLLGHNTSMDNLIEAFSLANRDDELFYRRISIRTNQEGILYHSIDNLGVNKENALNLMQSINTKLNWKPLIQVKNMGNLFYINEYESMTENIFKRLRVLSNKGFMNYSTYIQNEINRLSYTIDSDEKKNIILSLFEKSSVACIFGPAGTGKSTIARHISNLFQNSSKKYISNTHPAVMNMYRKVGGNKKDFMTIKKYLKEQERCDFLFIDECSMTSNKDFSRILDLQLFNYLILLGDIYQIQSIDFGSWFKFSRYLLKHSAVNELTELHRTSKPNLQILWENVRAKETVIDEILSAHFYTRVLDDKSLFIKQEDQIILCLNYDGLYGINNLNLIMQEENDNTSFRIGNVVYKPNDPILFLDNNKYVTVLYNNLKGKIVRIKEYEQSLQFILNVESNISVLDTQDFNGEISVIKNNIDGTTDICFSVEKEFDSDSDETISKLVPFQIAYATSIHKAQGLEYKNVKIVIDESCDEMITHDIFYTAITRATENLTIYWTQATQERVLKNINKDDSSKDISIFASKYGMKIHR